MKRILPYLILLLLGFPPFSLSAQRAFHVHIKGQESPLLFIGEETDSIVIENRGESGIVHTVYNNDKEYSHSLNQVDSISFNPDYFFIYAVDRDQKLRYTSSGEKYVVLDKEAKGFNILTHTNSGEPILISPESECDWFRCTQFYGERVEISMLENTTNKARQQKLKISKEDSGIEDSITIIQYPYEVLSFTPKLYYRDKNAQEIYLSYATFGWQTEGEVCYETNCDWATIRKETQSAGDSYYYVVLSENNTNDTRETNIVFRDDITADTIKIVQLNDEFWSEDSRSCAIDDSYAIFFLEKNEQTVSFQFNTQLGLSFSNSEIENEKSWFRLVSAKNDRLTFHVDANDTDGQREFYTEITIGDVATKRFTFAQAGKETPSNEEIEGALIDLYNATNGGDWERKQDWLSDKPYWQWQGINDNDVKYRIKYYLGSINLNHNNLIGELPESSSLLMNLATHDKEVLDLSGNSLYGEIPYNMLHHEKWPKYGWNVIQQNPWSGGGFETKDLNLRIDSVEVEDFVNNTVSNTYEMLRKNKVTWVFNAGAVDMIDGISDARVNKYLDYCDKGLGIIVTVGGIWDTPYDNYRNYVLEQQKTNGLPKSIVWTKGFDKADIGSYGSMSLLDSEGNLLWYRSYNYGLPDSYYFDLFDSILREHLGEPSEHEPYVSTHYKSTDYSRDGEVLTLQQASVGKGIDLVFMGDMYVDTLLVTGGQYEKDMREAMECFFGIEPYRTLRDRFNVYAVKVVSPNGHDGNEHKFNFNSELVFEYVQKIPNVDMDNVTVTVLDYNPNFSFLVSGETGMWESGASIAWIKEGGPSSIICHETGGHGFAKLLDEYIYSDYEGNHTQEGANESFREWIKTAYHDKGWGMNISATDDPDEVPWNRFLRDERYKDEIGIYLGAWMWPEELWRPSENSVMNKDYSWFNAPSREAIYKRVMQLSEGEEWTYDYETFVAFDAPMREAYVKAKAKARNLKIEDQGVQPRRINLRPPTIYKGSWRDGTRESVNIFEKSSNQSIPKRNLVAPTNDANENDMNRKIRPYILYKGERVAAEDFYKIGEFSK